jgi:predicted nucleic acid-binding protein
VGLTVLDAGPMIGLFSRRDVHHEASLRALGECRERGDQLVLPASALAEVLVYPSEQSPEDAETARRLLARLAVGVVSLDEEIAVETAGLRAVHSSRLPLPDAMVVATAIILDADRLVTTDRRWPHAVAMGFDGELVVV